MRSLNLQLECTRMDFSITCPNESSSYTLYAKSMHNAHLLGVFDEPSLLYSKG